MLPTNLAEARMMNFDIVTLPPDADTLITGVRQFHEATGREHTEFADEIAGFPVYCLVVARAKRQVGPLGFERKK